MRKVSVVFIAIFLIHVNSAWASGCDCSCWYIDYEVEKRSRYGGEFFELDRSGDSLVVSYNYTRRPSEKEKIGPFVLSGYDKVRGKLHPKLLERILKEKPRFTVELQNVKADLDGECAYEKFKTARVKATFRFKTGEFAELIYPTTGQLVDYGSGELQQDQVIPYFDPIWAF